MILSTTRRRTAAVALAGALSIAATAPRIGGAQSLAGIYEEAPVVGLEEQLFHLRQEVTRATGGSVDKSLHKTPPDGLNFRKQKS